MSLLLHWFEAFAIVIAILTATSLVQDWLEHRAITSKTHHRPRKD